jgi:hypothetical protein
MNTKEFILLKHYYALEILYYINILYNMNNKVLVIESKNGKVSQKYITKKEAQKHMSQRHVRLDRDAPKKSSKKSSKKTSKKSSKKTTKKSKK